MKAYLIYALVIAALGYGVTAMADKAGASAAQRTQAIEAQLDAIGA